MSSTLFTEVNGLLTLLEMNPELRTYLQNAINHYENSAVHITNEDRENIQKAITALSTLVSSTTNGIMSKEDKIKLDTVEENANNYVHPEQNLNTDRYYSVIKVDSKGHITEGYESEGFVETKNGKMTGETTAESIIVDNLKSETSTLNNTELNGLTNFNGTTNVNGSLNIKGELNFSGELSYDNMNLKTLYVTEGITSTGDDKLESATINKLNGTTGNIDTLVTNNGTIITGNITNLVADKTTTNSLNVINTLNADEIVVESDITVKGKLNLSQPISYDNFYTNTATINKSLSAPSADIEAINSTTIETDNLKVNSSMEVDSDANFFESVNITKNLNVYGSTTLKDTTIDGTINVSHNATFNGSIIANGEIDTNNIKSVATLEYVQNNSLQDVIQIGESPTVQNKLWYNSSNQELYYYNGTKWVSISEAASGTDTNSGKIIVSDEYQNPYEYDVWIDSLNKKLYYTKNQIDWIEFEETTTIIPYQVTEIEPENKTVFWIINGELRYYNDESWKNILKDPVSRTESEPDHSQLWLNSSGLQYYDEILGWTNVLSSSGETTTVYKLDNADTTGNNTIQIYYEANKNINAMKVLLDNDKRLIIGNDVLLQMDESNASNNDITKKQLIIDSNSLIKAYDSNKESWRVLSDISSSKPIISEDRFDNHSSLLINDNKVYFRDNQNNSNDVTTTKYIHPNKPYDIDTLTSNNNLLIKEGKLYYDDGNGTWKESSDYEFVEVESLTESHPDKICVYSNKFFNQKRLAIAVDTNRVETIESDDTSLLTNHNIIYTYSTSNKLYYYDYNLEMFVSSTYSLVDGDYDWILNDSILYDNRYKNIDFRYKDNSNTYYNPSDISKLNKDDSYITKDETGYHLYIYNPNMVELNTTNNA